MVDVQYIDKEHLEKLKSYYGWFRIYIKGYDVASDAERTIIFVSATKAREIAQELNDFADKIETSP